MNDYKEDYEKELEREGREAKAKKNMSPKTKRILNILIVLSFLLFAFFIIYTKYVPMKIEIIVVSIAVALTLLAINLEFKWLKIVTTIVLLIFSSILYYGQSTIEHLTKESKNATHSMSLIVLKDSELQSMEDAVSKKFGSYEEMDRELWDKFTSNYAEKLGLMKNLNIYENPRSRANALYDGDIDVMLLDEARRELLKIRYPKFDEETRVLDKIEIEKEVEIKEANRVDVKKEPFIVYISGIDSAGEIQEYARTDVNMLAVVNPKNSKILLISIPRDTYIPIPAFGGYEDKITHSGLEGVEASMDALSDYFGYDINYYAKFNFTSVINIIDIIGEVDVYSHYTFTSKDGYTYYEGMNTLNGKEALSFVRERYNVPGGDYTRGIHQMELVKGTINSLLKPNNILRLGNVVEEVSKNLETNMTTNEVSNILSSQLDLGNEIEINQAQLQGEGATGNYSYLMPGQDIYVMFPYDESRDEIIEQIEEIMNDN